MSLKSLIVLAGIGILMSLSACQTQQPGERSFKDPKFAGSNNFKSCNYCHAAGEKLKGATDKSSFVVDGKQYKRIEDVINQVMIAEYLGGKPIPDDSQEMKDLINYMTQFK